MPHTATLTFLPPASSSGWPSRWRRFPYPPVFRRPPTITWKARLDLNEHLIRHPAATFYVRVSGDSMSGAGIFDGDLLIVDRAAACTDGCIVVARLGDEFTLKRILKKGNRVFLQPENENFQPIEVTEDTDCEIWGRVVGSVRRY